MINQEMYLADLNNLLNKPMRDGYGEALMEIGKNKNIVVLCGDLMESTRTDIFKEAYPDRYLEMGISEQNMMGVAAGLALSGKTPFVNSFACFSPGRNWEQMRISVALTNNNVKVIGGHAGFGNGADGGNQQMFEDVALTRVLPNVVVIAPCDYEQIKKATKAIAEYHGAVYMRMTKQSRPIITTRMTPFEIGKAQVMREGKDVTVFCNGQMVFESLVAATKIESVDVEVVIVHTVKPLDKETIITSARKTGKVVVAEEHSVIGGLGGAIAELLSEENPVRIKRVGMTSFGESGEVGLLQEKSGLNWQGIIKAIKSLG